MGRKFPWWKKKGDDGDLKTQEAPLPDLDRLLKDYDFERFLLDSQASMQGHTQELDFRRLRKVEDQIIELMPEPFQRSVMKILARRGFDIRAYIKDNWRDVLSADVGANCGEVCDYLGRRWKLDIWEGRQPYPFSGCELFWYFLAAAKESHSADFAGRFNAIGSRLMEIKKRGEILGHPMDAPELESLFFRVGVVFLGEWAKRTMVTMDIVCEAEGGEAFIREIIEKHK